jgi:hypothetical protein
MEGIFVRCGIKSKKDLVSCWRNNKRFSLIVGNKNKGSFSKSDFPRKELISLRSKDIVAVILN